MMPIAAPLYPPPPYEFRRARQTWVLHEADRGPIEEILPEGVELEEGPAVCAAWACHYPVSSFGPYLEAYVVVRVVVGGERFWYQPVIVTDAEAPMAAGREVWGYGKKLAHLQWSDERSGGPGTEQLMMSVERPAGLSLMRLTMVPERLLSGAELVQVPGAEPLPVLSHRVLDGLVDELVAVEVGPRTHRGADGRPELWRGRGHVTYGGGAADPWHIFQPTRMLDAFTVCTDFTLGRGRVVPRGSNQPEES